MTDVASDRPKKERSPSFPFISLSKAIHRAEQMLAAHRRSPARPSVVGETWGYSASSSGFIQTVAALRAYGLLDDTGRGEDRRIQISELAQRILNDSRPGAREVAILEAARKPKLMLEFIGLWLPDKPSDAHRISELTLDRGFTFEAAKTFLRIFDDNISFSKLNGGDKIEDVNLEEPLDQVQHQVASATQERPRTGIGAIATAIKAATNPVATLPLPEGVASLVIPSELSERSVKALRQWLDVMVGLSTKAGENN